MVPPCCFFRRPISSPCRLVTISSCKNIPHRVLAWSCLRAVASWRRRGLGNGGVAPWRFLPSYYCVGVRWCQLAALKECKAEVVALCEASSCNPILVRLAWHDAGKHPVVIPAAAIIARRMFGLSRVACCFSPCAKTHSSEISTVY